MRRRRAWRPCLWAMLALAWALPLSAAAGSEDSLSLPLVADLFPGATGVGPVEGSPPVQPIYRGEGQVVGYAFRSQAVIGSLGYSGRPVDVAVAIDLAARIQGAALLDHREPILVLGIEESRLHDFVAAHRGLDPLAPPKLERLFGGQALPPVIAGASVSSKLLADAILRSARAVARARGLRQASGGVSVEMDLFAPRDWASLLAEGAVAHRRITGREVIDRLAAAGVALANAPAPDAPFIDLFAALLTPAGIGRNILGDRGFVHLAATLAPGDQTVLIAADGFYSFKGADFARSGRFDRVRIVQGAFTFALTASQHRRIDALGPGMPEFREIGLFNLPADSGFDPAQPWRLELLVEAPRADGTAHQEVFALPYALPERLLHRVVAAAGPGGNDERLAWQEVWYGNPIKIAITGLALLLLTLGLVVEDAIGRRKRLWRWLRPAFLAFTLLWFGGYALGQLSVINVVTFTHSLLSGFRWEVFLLEPVTFLLWSFLAVALLFWGRGVYCGWLCPFGALQEFVFRLGRWLRLPTWRPPFALHERLWVVKYVVFIAVFALSLNVTDLAIAAAEAEPFKTVIALRFARAWPFVLYAVAVLGAGLFVERFFCRYLCPLGGALAIPAKLRMFEWLKRRRQCGVECNICFNNCPVQAIHPDGRINPNECIYCLQCQVLYYDDETCVPLVLRRKKREARVLAAEAARQAAAEGGDD